MAQFSPRSGQVRERQAPRVGAKSGLGSERPVCLHPAPCSAIGGAWSPQDDPATPNARRAAGEQFRRHRVDRAERWPRNDLSAPYLPTLHLRIARHPVPCAPRCERCGGHCPSGNVLRQRRQRGPYGRRRTAAEPTPCELCAPSVVGSPAGCTRQGASGARSPALGPECAMLASRESSPGLGVSGPPL